MDSSTSSDDPDLARLRGLVDDALRGPVDALIAEEGELTRFGEALRYPLGAGGKRLRPVLLLATVEALGGELAPALAPACALELVHTFSLVHDDLPALDDDALRRGLPTTHVAYAEDIAILVGDGLLTLAFRVIAEGRGLDADARLALIGELARATDGMVRGQYLDLYPSTTPDEAWVRRMCSLKTGCLLEAAIGMGLRVAGADDATAAAYRALGTEIGVAFQIVDDVLDATSTSDELGKTAGADEANDRSTWVRVLGLEEAQAHAEASWRRADAMLDALPGDTRALRACVELIYRRTN
ncbi:MAG: polyprenyl synthetase family protein [Gaiellales bacterium]